MSSSGPGGSCNPAANLLNLRLLALHTAQPQYHKPPREAGGGEGEGGKGGRVWEADRVQTKVRTVSMQKQC